MKNIYFFKLGIFLSIFITEARASEVVGAQFPAQKKVGDQTLVLNGVGVRKATLFKVKVYTGALYVSEKSQDDDHILNSDPKATKEMDTVFLRDVDAEKIRETWKEGFQKNCKGECERLAPVFAQFLLATHGAKSGDHVNYVFLADSVRVEWGSFPAQMIQGGKDLNRVLLSSWLGPNPTDRDLKSSLLDCGKEGSCK